MRPFPGTSVRFLFAPELGRPIADALSDAALMARRIERARNRRQPEARPAIAARGLAVLLLVLVLAGLALAAVPPPDAAFGQSIERGLFADSDSATREVLSFLGGLGRDRPSAVGEALGEGFIGPLVGGGVQDIMAYLVALLFLMFRPYGLFGEEMIERV